MLKILREIDYKTTSWTSGSTTELFIYPENSVFAERQFVFRLSKATVEVETTHFTVFPGYTRWIMPLDGPLFLEFKSNNQLLYHIQLKAFQPHCFKGEWQTHSRGKVSDFNLMMKDHRKGEIFKLDLPKGETDLSQFLADVTDARRYLYALHIVKGDLLVDESWAHTNETVIKYSDSFVESFIVENKCDNDVQAILVQMII